MDKKTRITVVLLITLLLVVFLTYKAFSKPEEDDSGEENIEVIETTKEDSISIVKKNIVRVINKVGSKEIIGTGYLDESGYIVTSNNVVNIKGDIEIKYPNGQKEKGELISNNDSIALIKVNNPPVQLLKRGNNTDGVAVVGYSNKTPTIKKGTISKKENNKLEMNLLLEDSYLGSPIVNGEGEIIGIVTTNGNGTNSNPTIGTVPTKELIQELIKDKNVTYKEDNPVTKMEEPKQATYRKTENNTNQDSSSSENTNNQEEEPTPPEPEPPEEPEEIDDYESDLDRITQLQNKYDSISNPSAVIMPTYDYVQPWQFNEYNYQDMREYVDHLKRAGYQGIIIQYSSEFATENNVPKLTSAWYDSTLVDDPTSLELYRSNALDRLIQVLEEKNMELYIGLSSSNEWFENKFIDSTWRTNINQLNQSLLTELYEKYHSYNCFKGWYYTFEFYIQNENFFETWSSMLTNTIEKVDELDSSKKVMISLFVSNYYNVGYETTQNLFLEFINNTSFRDGDIINMQDCLGTSNYSVEKVDHYIQAIKNACDLADINVDFWLNIENYEHKEDMFTPASLERYLLQVEIASNYASTLASFAYSHYYSSLEYDKAYRAIYTNITGNTLTMIETPSNGIVYEDENGDEVPVPVGFSVDENSNVVEDGLVISDEAGNQFVWVPVKGGVKDSCYTYQNDEFKAIYYSKYLNSGVACSNTSNDTLPNGVDSDNTQINKYKGFYIGRYETSFGYNSGDYRPRIMPSTASPDYFSYQYADSDFYTGYLWNNINYASAKEISESMSTKYNYDSTIKTGLVNGTQWDTVLKWVHSNDDTYNMIYDSRSWGNYTDAIDPANTGNYETGVLKPSGSNESWKAMNIYDMAGNLSEWTSELSDSKAVVRGYSYTNTGQYGAGSRFTADSYQYPHVGFRVVLYID